MWLYARLLVMHLFFSKLHTFICSQGDCWNLGRDPCHIFAGTLCWLGPATLCECLQLRICYYFGREGGADAPVLSNILQLSNEPEADIVSVVYSQYLLLPEWLYTSIFKFVDAGPEIANICALFLITPHQPHHCMLQLSCVSHLHRVHAGALGMSTCCRVDAYSVKYCELIDQPMRARQVFESWLSFIALNTNIKQSSFVRLGRCLPTHTRMPMHAKRNCHRRTTIITLYTRTACMPSLLTPSTSPTSHPPCRRL